MLECLRAGVPATALYVALGAQADERLTESVTLAADSGIAILEVPRTDLDRMTTNGLHQGIALQVPPYEYLHPDELIKTALDTPPALLVALDNISDPRNLGAIVRSVAAFAGHGVLIPQRRSASVTAVAWRTSAGAAARVPVARATNLTRTLKDWADRGLQLIGLDADGDTVLDDLDGAGPLVVVVGSEGKGSVAAGASELRRGGVDPDGRPRGIVERLGGRRGGPGRDRPSAQELVVRLGAVLVAVVVLATAPPVAAESPEFDLQAHAGGRGQATGESLQAFAKSLELGVSTLELDINVTKDHQPLVWHDSIIEPQQCSDTGPAFAGDASYPYVGKPVHDLTLAQIHTLDCGKPDNQFPDAEVVQGNRIATLPDVFALADSYHADVRYNIETKVAADRPAISADPPEFVDVVLAAVQGGGQGRPRGNPKLRLASVAVRAPGRAVDSAGGVME